jgi:amino acid transporter
MFATARDGMLPRALGRVHPRHGSPYVASAVQLVLLVVVIALLSTGGPDPYLQITAPVLALGTLGVILLQAGTSIAVIAYFRQSADRRWWTTLVAPGLAALGLVTSVVLVCKNFSALTGSDSTVVGLLPWLYVLGFALGALRAAWLRSARPSVYGQLGSNYAAPEQAPAPAAALATT